MVVNRLLDSRSEDDRTPIQDHELDAMVYDPSRLRDPVKQTDPKPPVVADALR